MCGLQSLWWPKPAQDTVSGASNTCAGLSLQQLVKLSFNSSFQGCELMAALGPDLVHYMLRARMLVGAAAVRLSFVLSDREASPSNVALRASSFLKRRPVDVRFDHMWVALLITMEEHQQSAEGERQLHAFINKHGLYYLVGQVVRGVPASDAMRDAVKATVPWPELRSYVGDPSTAAHLPHSAANTTFVDVWHRRVYVHMMTAGARQDLQHDAAMAIAGLRFAMLRHMVARIVHTHLCTIKARLWRPEGRLVQQRKQRVGQQDVTQGDGPDCAAAAEKCSDADTADLAAWRQMQAEGSLYRFAVPVL